MNDININTPNYTQEEFEEALANIQHFTDIHLMMIALGYSLINQNTAIAQALMRLMLERVKKKL